MSKKALLPASVTSGEPIPKCRAREILDRVGDKWSTEVIYQLSGGERRFTELRRAVDGISQRMLTATLRALERDGIVRRTVFPVVPPRVEYKLTPLGVTLRGIVESLVVWATEHTADIDAARADFDRRAMN